MLGLNLQYHLPALPAPDEKTAGSGVRLQRTTIRREPLADPRQRKADRGGSVR